MPRKKINLTLQDQECYSKKLSELTTQQFVKLSTWMDNSLIRKCRFWDLCLPGTHNSASWQLAEESDRRWGGIVFHFVKQYIHCQTANIYNQLQLGARFLDLRVCRHLKRQGEPYCAHGGFRTVPFKTVLQQVAQFVSTHPSEIVVLSVRRDVAFMRGKGSIGMVESDFWVAFYLKEFLGPRLTADITIEQLTKRRQNVLYFFEERERYIPEKVFSDMFITAPTKLASKKKKYRKQLELSPAMSEEESMLDTTPGMTGRMIVGTVTPIRNDVSKLREKKKFLWPNILHKKNDVSSCVSDNQPGEINKALKESDTKAEKTYSKLTSKKKIDFKTSETDSEYDTKLRHMVTVWINNNMKRYALVSPPTPEHRKKEVKISENDAIKKNCLKEKKLNQHFLFERKGVLRGQHTKKIKQRRCHSVPKTKYRNHVSLSNDVTEAVRKQHLNNTVTGLQHNKWQKFQRSDSLPFVFDHERDIHFVERALGHRHRHSIFNDNKTRRNHILDLVSRRNRHDYYYKNPLTQENKISTQFSKKVLTRYIEKREHKTNKSHSSSNSSEEDKGAASDRSGITAVHAADAVKRLLSQGVRKQNVMSLEKIPIINRGSKRHQKLFFNRPVYSEPDMRGFLTISTREQTVCEGFSIAPTTCSDKESNDNVIFRRRTIAFTNMNENFNFCTSSSSIPLLAKHNHTYLPFKTRHPATSHDKPPLKKFPSKQGKGFRLRRRHSFLVHVFENLPSQASGATPFDKSEFITKRRPSIDTKKKKKDVEIVQRTNFLTPFVAGETRIIKSWSVTSDPNPQLLCNKLNYWSSTYGVPQPQKPFLLKILAGEITPPSLGTQKASVFKFWTVQGASALCMRKSGLQCAAVETHKLLLKQVLKRSITNRINGITHDFINDKVVARIIKLNIINLQQNEQTKEQPIAF